MMKAILSSAMVVVALWTGASESPDANGSKIFVGGSGRAMELDSAGAVVRSWKAGTVHDAWRLPNGNVLLADFDAVTEKTPDGKVVFQYKPKETHGGGVPTCQRLANGDTLVGENSTGRILEISPDGRELFALQLPDYKPGDHQNLRMARKLDNGHYLVCHSGRHVVREYQPDGKVVWEKKTPNLCFAAVRLPNGNTLVSCLDKLIEYDFAGQEVWTLSNTDFPGEVVTNMTGFHVVGGTIAVGCYSAYKNGQGLGVFVVEKATKKLIWKYSKPNSDRSLMAVQILDGHGQVLPAVPLR